MIGNKEKGSSMLCGSAQQSLQNHIENAATDDQRHTEPVMGSSTHNSFYMLTYQIETH